MAGLPPRPEPRSAPLDGRLGFAPGAAPGLLWRSTVHTALFIAAALSAAPLTPPGPSASVSAPAGAAASPSPTTSPERVPASDAASLSLGAALAELDRQSPTLAQARGRADEASSLVRQAASGLLPGLTATGSFVRNRDDAVMGLGAFLAALPNPPAVIPPPTIIQPLEAFSGTLAVRVPLLVPQAWFDLAAARDGARGAAASAEATRLALRASLVTTAHLGLAAEEAVAATERAEANAAQLAESAERRLAAGTAAPLDALRARTEQVKRQGDLVRARADLERVQLAAGTLLGREAPVRILVEGETWSAAPAPGAGPATAAPRRADADLVAEALGHRPEVTAAAAQVASSESQVSSALARFAPQLSLSGSIFAQDVAYPTGETDGWRVGVDLTWPLYDGGLRYGKRREAEARLAQARAGEVSARLQVSQEARDAARDEAVAAERLRLAVEQRRLATEAEATAQRSYRAGVLSSLDVIDAGDRLYAADIGLADARARLAAARVALARALGRGP